MGHAVRRERGRGRRAATISTICARTTASRLHALAARIELPRQQGAAFQALLDIWAGAGEAKDALLEELVHHRELLKAVTDNSAHGGTRGKKRPLSAVAGSSGGGDGAAQ